MARRPGFGSLLACAVVLLGLAPASAAAQQWDWAVNGSQLPAGKKVAVTFATTTVLTLTVPALELTVTCESASGTGHLVGGLTGAGAIKSPNETCEFRKDHLEPNTCRFKLVDGDLSVGESGGAAPPDEIAVNVQEIRLKGRFSGGRTQETLKGQGAVWAVGPVPGENRFIFGAASHASTLTINGAPATLETQVLLGVKGNPGASIGYAPLG